MPMLLLFGKGDFSVVLAFFIPFRFFCDAKYKRMARDVIDPIANIWLSIIYFV